MIVHSPAAQTYEEADAFRDECGVFAVSHIDEAAALISLGLHALQHRGQEAAGIVTWDDAQFYSHRALGEVGEEFNTPDVISHLKGHSGIGHVRYSTTGEPLLRNVQPIFAELEFGGLAVAHNGNLTNALTLRHELVRRGCIFQSTMDSETIIHLVAISNKETVTERLIDALSQIEGAYSIVAMSDDMVIGVRDPYGVRPLVLGRRDDSYVLASETCALDIIGAEKVRDVKPGEMVVLKGNHFTSMMPFQQVKPRFCVFEYIYFARPDSVLEDKSVYAARKQIGMELAKEHPVEADIVVPVPDSGVPAAIGYAEASHTPFDLGIIRNHYVGRTFIEPTQQIRNLGVRLKHNANPLFVKDRRVVLIDDSIVRGTTSRKIVAMVRDAGAREVHMRIASPPTTHACFYGVNTPSREELLAANHTVPEMAELIGADSLAFISLDGLYRAMGEAKRLNDSPQYCDACFSGDYAITLTDHHNGKASGNRPEHAISRMRALRS